MQKREGRNNLWFNQRIPADVKTKARGRRLEVPIGPEVVEHAIPPTADAIRLSLRTPDKQAAKVRTLQVSAYLGSVWQALREGHGVPLTHRQAVALARDLYAGWAEARERQVAVSLDRETKEPLPDDPSGWEEDEAWASVQAMLNDGTKEECIVGTMSPLVDRLLLRKRIAGVDPDSRAMVTTEFLRSMRDAAAVRLRNAQGDYSPDPKAQRFPEWENTAKASGVTLESLLEGWWADAKRGGRSLGTYYQFRTRIWALKEHLGHDDAARVKPADILAFKDARLAKGVSMRTIATGDYAVLRSIFGWAVDNLKLAKSPMDGIKNPKVAKTQVREKDFTEDEAKAILKAALGVPLSNSNPKQSATLRWVPWLCAYTGARVGEIIQLRQQDVHQKDDVWFITITPEAGTVKNKKARNVVLHEHLVEMGFPAFAGAGTGHLFLPEPFATDEELHAALARARKWLVRFVRNLVDDPNVSPNHAWRHLFKSIGRGEGIEDTVLDGICGHSPGSIGAAYGSVPIKAQVAAMEKFPRFDVSP